MENQNTSVMSVKDWLITILITAIPVVNIIMLLIWAFGGGDVNVNKKNWALATLIWMAIFIALYIFLFVLLGIGAAFMDS